MESSIKDIVEHINDNGGFTDVGWFKRGVIKNRSLVESNGNNGNSGNSGTNK